MCRRNPRPLCFVSPRKFRPKYRFFIHRHLDKTAIPRLINELGGQIVIDFFIHAAASMVREGAGTRAATAENLAWSIEKFAREIAPFVDTNF